MCVFTWSHYNYLDSVQDGATALWLAACFGHVRAVKLLIAAKALVDIHQVRFTVFLKNYVICCTEWSHSIAHSQSGGSL